MSQFDLIEELAHLQDGSYSIPNEAFLDEVSAAEQAATVNTIIDSISSDPDNITSPEVFDSARSFLKYFAHFAPELRPKLLDSLLSSFVQALDAAAREADNPQDPNAYAKHAQSIETYAFLLQWFVTVAETEKEKKDGAAIVSAASSTKARRGGAKGTNAKKDGDVWTWPSFLPSILSVMSKALRVQSARMWTVTATRDAYVAGCVVRAALLLQENEAYMKVGEIKLGIFKVICQSVKGHGQAFHVQTSIMQALQYYEHLADPMAELLKVLRDEFDYERLGLDVLREVASKTFTGMDSKGPKSFGRFIVRMTELSPRSVLKQISLLQKHMDSEAYPMRNSLIEATGLLITELTNTEDSFETSLRSRTSIGPDDADRSNDAGLSMATLEGRTKQIELFFNLILERFLDLHSRVRSKVITVCSHLCELPSKFPRQRTQLTDLTVRALEDKSSWVRKSAIGLLTKLILTHPYGLMHGGELNADDWRKRHELVQSELATFEGVLNIPAEAGEDESVADESIASGSSDSPAHSKSPNPRKSIDLEALAAAQESMTEADAEKLMKLRLTSRYYADALHFIGQLDGAMPILSQLLVSKNKAEVLESMEFFRVAYEYHIAGASEGVRKMVHLIWTKDNTLVGEDGKELKGVRSRLIEVYRSLWFEPLAELSDKDNVARIARNMIERTTGATIAELTSTEALFSTMMAEDMVHPDVISKLWAVYSARQSIPRAQRRGAIIVLGMLAVANRDVVSERMDVLLNVGLGPLGAKDIVLAKFTCVALSRVGGSVKKVKGALGDESIRYPMKDALFAKLRAVLLMQSDSPEWFSLAEHAVQTTYLLGEQPEQLASDVIKVLTLRVFGPEGQSISTPQTQTAADGNATATPEPRTPQLQRSELPSESTPTASQPAAPQTPNTATHAPAVYLAQLLFVVGHVALKQIVYLELVEREYKRRKAESDSASKAQAANNAASGAEPSSDASAKDELEQVAGNAEDEIGDVVAAVREKELLYGTQSLLTLFGPLVVHVCSSPQAYPNELLRKAAVLTLCKFLCVSSSFCEAHLPLLLHILATSNDAGIRSNVVIALGDMAICFGLLVNENSDRLYAGLGDRDLGVKKHTLMVLTHLILNGMIKVKGQLGEIAKCLEDDDPRVSDLTKLFFSELDKKENAVYNNLPDIISHLSIGKYAVDEPTFARTMRFIFGFIDKEKQAENVVEKLCQRFRLTSEERQWRDIAFCLSLLPYKSDRSVKRLIDGLPFYQDKLHDPEVFERFSEILAKARSNTSGSSASKATSEGASDLADFQAILDGFRKTGEEDARFEKKTAKRVAKATKRVARGEGKRAPAKSALKGKASREDKENEDEEEEWDTTPKNAAVPLKVATNARSIRPTRAARGGRARIIDEDSDDE